MTTTADIPASVRAVMALVPNGEALAVALREARDAVQANRRLRSTTDDQAERDRLYKLFPALCKTERDAGEALTAACKGDADARAMLWRWAMRGTP